MRLHELTEAGKTRGYVLCDEIDELLPADYEGGPELDDILAALESAGVLVVAAPGPEPTDDFGGGNDLLDVCDDPLRVYMREVARLKTEAAKVTLVEANLRPVISLATRYANDDLRILDLIQEGDAGLLSAAEQFDPERGYRFSTYGAWRARRFILQASRK